MQYLIVIADALAKGEKVSLVVNGNFEVRQRAKTQGQKLATSKEITNSATNTPVFKAGKSLKDKVNM